MAMKDNESTTPNGVTAAKVVLLDSQLLKEKRVKFLKTLTKDAKTGGLTDRSVLVELIENKNSIKLSASVIGSLERGKNKVQWIYWKTVAEFLGLNPYTSCGVVAYDKDGRQLKAVEADSGGENKSYRWKLAQKVPDEQATHPKSKQVGKNTEEDISETTRKTLNSGYAVPANLAHHAKIDVWKVYEAAFLWHELEPPSVEAHFALMSEAVAQTKLELHNAIERGELPLVKQETILTPVFALGGVATIPQGFTRYVHRKDLLAYAKKHGKVPAFLKKR